MSDNENEANEANEAAEAAEALDKAEEQAPPRKVTISRKVKVVFESRSGKPAVVQHVNRDLYSVMDAVTARLAATSSKEELEDILVTVLSVEDPELSDPVPEGESRWEGPYGVGGAVIQQLPIPKAMEEFMKAILPGDACMQLFERLAEQCFMRSRMDGMVIVCTFDGTPATVPLLTSFRDLSPASLAVLYRQLHVQAENLRRYITTKFPKLEVEWVPPKEEKPEEPVKADTSGIVLPSGAPAEPGERKFLSAKDIMDNSTRIVHITD